MSNSSNNHGALAGAQAVILSDNAAKENKINLIKNVIAIIVCAGILVLLLKVYRQWQTIPYIKHSFNVEHLASAKGAARVGAKFCLIDPKNLDMACDLSSDTIINTLSTIILSKSNDNNINDRYVDACFISTNSANKLSRPLQPYYTDSLSKLIGQQLFDELNDACKAGNINVHDYYEIFFYRHLDNETALEKSFLTEHDQSSSFNGAIVYEKNHYALSDYEREKAIGLTTHDFSDKPVNSETMSKSTYKNIFQAFLLASQNKYKLINVFTQISSKNTARFWEYLLKPEDISQTHYSFVLHSKSISDLYLKVEFWGAIQCTYTHKKSIYSNEYVEHAKYTSVNIGDSYIELLRKNNGFSDVHYEVLVKFNDMHNMQAFRLFMLAAMITLCFTQMVKSFVKVFIILITREKKKKAITCNINQEDNDDVPGFYL